MPTDLQVRDYIDRQYAKLIPAAQITDDDLEAAVAEVMAYYAADVNLGDRWYRPLADYYVLKQAMANWTANFDASLSGRSFSLSQQYKNVESQFKIAQSTVGWLTEGEGTSTEEETSTLEPFEISNDVFYSTAGEW